MSDDPPLPYTAMEPEQLRDAYRLEWNRKASGRGREAGAAAVRLALIEAVARKRGIDLSSPAAPALG